MKQNKLFEIFSRTKKTKKDKKDINAMIKDALVNSKNYMDALEARNESVVELKKAKGKVLMDFSKELENLDVLEADERNDNQLLTDLAINKITKGENPNIKDENGNEYEAIFSVKFKKI